MPAAMVLSETFYEQFQVIPLRGDDFTAVSITAAYPYFHLAPIHSMRHSRGRQPETSAISRHSRARGC